MEMKMKGDRVLGFVHKEGDTSVGNNKVLPIGDSASSSSSSLSVQLSPINSNIVEDQQQCGACSGRKKGKLVDGENKNNKTLSRMKELFRWAAAINLGKTKGLQFRNRSRTKKGGRLEDDELNDDSPKISLKWEVETCFSAPASLNYYRTGSWITTDHDFVVLEL